MQERGESQSNDTPTGAVRPSAAEHTAPARAVRIEWLETQPEMTGKGDSWQRE